MVGEVALRRSPFQSRELEQLPRMGYLPFSTHILSPSVMTCAQPPGGTDAGLRACIASTSCKSSDVSREPKTARFYT